MHRMEKHKGFTIATLNTRSLEPRMSEVKEILRTTKLDILAITETWCDDTKCRVLEVDDYTIVRKDRNRRGGGVLLYIRNGIEYKERNDLEHPDIEATWIELSTLLNKQKTLVAVYYRPPDKKQEYYNSTVDMLDKAYLEGKQLIVLGDFNWDYNLGQNYEKNPVRYLEDLTGTQQLVEDYTRVTKTTKTTIDLILSSSPNDHLYTGICQTSGSDHYMPYTIIKAKRVKTIHKTATFRNYKDLDDFDKWDEFLEDLEEALTDLKLNNDRDPNSITTEKAWETFKTTLNTKSDTYAPIESKRLRSNHKHWVTPEIIKIMHERDRLHRKATQTNDDNLWSNYKRLRNRVVTLVRKEQKKAMEELVESRKKDPTKFWKDLTNMLPRKINMASIPKNLSLDDLNMYFSTIGGKNITEMEYKKAKKGMPWKGDISIHNFSIQEIRKCDVEELLQKLPDKPNLDILSIDCRILRKSAEIIAAPLTWIFNKSIQEGIVPQEWKNAKVSPAYKNKGDKDDPGNYRPISVVGHIPKLIEKLIGGQFINYLTSNALITKDQSAYLKGHSTQSSLHKLMDDILENADEGEVTAACFLDISKCFDSICHDFLLQKLKNYGIRENLSWFTSYLTDRTQQVSHNGNLSTKLPVNAGVPQGSVLGPFLFILFANDLGNFVNGGLLNCYADDTVIYTTGATANEAKLKLQQCLKEVEFWYTENKLKVNTSKSMVMLFGTQQRLSKLNDQMNKVLFGQQPLEETTVYKYLGLYLDPGLTWNSHVQEVIKKSVFKLHLMRRLAKILQKDTMVQVYKTYLMPIIEYGATVWGFTSSGNTTKINHIINTAARIICNNYDYITVRGAELAKQLKINSFEERRNYLLAVLTYKLMNDEDHKMPLYMKDKLTMVSELAEHGTRGACNSKLNQPRANIKMFENTFLWRAPRIWNDLDDAIKSKESLGTFKEAYKVDILGQPPRYQPIMDDFALL